MQNNFFGSFAEDFQSLADLVPDGIGRDSELVRYLFIAFSVTFRKKEDFPAFVWKGIYGSPERASTNESSLSMSSSICFSAASIAS